MDYLIIDIDTVQGLYSEAPGYVYEVDFIRDSSGKKGGMQTEIINDGEFISLIEIDVSLKPYQKVAIFFHELGHHNCRESCCSCCPDGFQFSDDVLAEVHAMKFSLQQCADRGYLESHRWLVELIEEQSDKSNGFPEVCVLSSGIIMQDEQWGYHLQIHEGK